MNIDIRKGSYNKTCAIRDEDGVERHEVDTSTNYTYYEVTTFERYYDVDEHTLLIQMLRDFKDLCNETERRLQKIEARSCEKRCKR